MTTESNDLQMHLEEILKKENATFMATVMATMTAMKKENATLKKEKATLKKENATLKESLNTEEQNILNRDMKTEDDEEIEFKKFEENGEYGIMGKMFNAEAAQQREQNILNRDMKTEDDEEKKIVSQEEDNSDKKTKLDCCMRNHFEDGQRIRHTISKIINDTRIGIYNKVKDEIHYEGQKYKSPSGFASSHYKQKRPDRKPETNGWKNCEYEVDGKWIKIDTFRKCLKV